MFSFSSGRSSVRYRRLFRDAFIAAVLAASLNVLLYGLAASLGLIPQLTSAPPSRVSFGLAPVVLGSVVGVVGAASLFTLLMFANPRAKRAFWVVAVLVFVLMFWTPFSIPGAPLSMIAVIELMHVVATVAALWPVARA